MTSSVSEVVAANAEMLRQRYAEPRSEEDVLKAIEAVREGVKLILQSTNLLMSHTDDLESFVNALAESLQDWDVLGIEATEEIFEEIINQH